MIFREATQVDFDYVADNSISRGVQKYHPGQVEFCYTLEHEGVPLGIGGFHLINPSTAWCWVDMTPASYRRIKTTYKTIKEWIDIFAEEHNLKRLQAYVECDFKEAVRMIEHLGFEQEYIMKNFVGTKDAFMYRRLL